MSNYNIEEMARGMGFNDTYLNKLKSANQYISESSNQDRNKINAQLNQTLSDYEKERADQNKNFINEAQNAYVDYAKAINPYSTQRSQANRIGLGNSGYSESSLIGANNAYQNRYTNTKTNYDNIFANINNNIAKARETSNIELAKIAQNEQERLLENLYKFNDEYTAEKQREEEKRRWEAEREEERRRWEAEREEERRRYEEQMELQRQSVTRSSSRSSGSSSPQWIDGDGKAPEYTPTTAYKFALGLAKQQQSKGMSNEEIAKLLSGSVNKNIYGYTLTAEDARQVIKNL